MQQRDNDDILGDVGAIRGNAQINRRGRDNRHIGMTNLVFDSGRKQQTEGSKRLLTQEANQFIATHEQIPFVDWRLLTR
jgi:hypothetical protein